MIQSSRMLIRVEMCIVENGEMTDFNMHINITKLLYYLKYIYKILSI